ncbi:copper-containing nitrite reductase [Fodinibius saliphilus]|uniref:copper-containing nitrite reductase n=1 Tax=Fodinibius saliphilus TaxID=1920650 RepID=UPI0011097159|nr:copper-containing nitrite reductase [Fodinibius saliphilus]
METKNDKTVENKDLNIDGKQSRKKFLRNTGAALLSGGFLASMGFPFKSKANDVVTPSSTDPASTSIFSLPKVNRVAADPTDIPAPIKRRTPKTHEITLESKEVVAEIEDGVKFKYLTYGGQVPGPMLRVRRGDTIILNHKNLTDNTMIHNVDFHACYGPGGAADATICPPGQSKKVKFKAMYPGAYIYHCAVPRMDYHISSGMYGMILVEPEEGLPEVDHEFYFGQNEIYTDKAAGTKGLHGFDTERMKAEDPTYVVLNGEKYAITGNRHGALTVKKGDTARVYLVTGGPNVTSNFHPIGNVFTKAWREGAIASEPERYVQTCQVPPGSCGIFEMDFPVPGPVKMVDHALTRVAKKGMLGIINVEGAKEADIFDPDIT